MRILGHVTTAVQTIKNGFTSGNFQFSAKVVLDLNKNLDTFSIAGHKMSKQLSQDLPVAADQAQDDHNVPADALSRLPAAPYSDVDVVATPKPKRSPTKPNKKASESHPLTPPRPSPTTLPQDTPSPATVNPASSLLFSPSFPLVLDSISTKTCSTRISSSFVWLIVESCRLVLQWMIQMCTPRLPGQIILLV